MLAKLKIFKTSQCHHQTPSLCHHEALPKAKAKAKAKVAASPTDAAANGS